MLVFSSQISTESPVKLHSLNTTTHSEVKGSVGSTTGGMGSTTGGSYPGYSQAENSAKH